jgi:hypothetical protein
MPIYKLEPIAGTEEHNDWRASSLPPTPVWVRATDPDHARQRMRLATMERRIYSFSNSIPYNPWSNAALVRCTEDTSWDVPANVALFANGKIKLQLQKDAYSDGFADWLFVHQALPPIRQRLRCAADTATAPWRACDAPPKKQKLLYNSISYARIAGWAT